jgi:hypothetical protein
MELKDLKTLRLLIQQAAFDLERTARYALPGTLERAALVAAVSEVERALVHVERRIREYPKGDL